MSHTRLWTSAAIIAFVVIIGFALSVPHTRDSGRSFFPSDVKTSIPTVTLHDVYRKGTHTITGSVIAADACASVSATATRSSNADAENILVAISLSEGVGICLQIPTPMNFQTSVNAPAHLPITVTVNGSVATTTAS